MDKYVAVVRRKSDEDMTHWKYVKREKQNGKWKYYYENTVNTVADKLGVDERKALKQQETILEYKRGKEVKSESDKLDQEIRAKYRGDDPKVRAEYRELVVKNINDSAEVYKTEQKVKKLIEEYANTPLGKVENITKAGAKFIEDVLGITDRKERLENEENQRKIDEDETRRRIIETDEARVKANKQKAKRDAALRKEEQVFEAEAKRLADEAKAKAKAQKIARDEALEKERKRLQEESKRRKEEDTRPNGIGKRLLIATRR